MFRPANLSQFPSLRGFQCTTRILLIQMADRPPARLWIPGALRVLRGLDARKRQGYSLGGDQGERCRTGFREDYPRQAGAALKVIPSLVRRILPRKFLLLLSAQGPGAKARIRGGTPSAENQRGDGARQDAVNGERQQAAPLEKADRAGDRQIAGTERCKKAGDQSDGSHVFASQVRDLK